MQILTSTPIALLIYLALVTLLYLVGKALAVRRTRRLRNPASMAAVKKPLPRLPLRVTARFFSLHFSSPYCTWVCW